jgi:UDP-N-acetylmuramate--alanine ligase
MTLNEAKTVYFLGIGGIGMSAIARYFNHLGLNVLGYDKTETSLTIELQKEGIDIHYRDLGKEVGVLTPDKNTTLVVVTPAVPKDHQELNWFIQNGYTIQKRSQVLGIITNAYKSIAVSGTHGKTTTSTLIAHLLKQSSLNCSAFLGGISANYESNLLLNNSNESINLQWMVTEADEFDRSFLTLYPSIGIITSTDADHLDIYGKHEALLHSFSEFASQVKDILIVKQELTTQKELLANTKSKVITYSAQTDADYCAPEIFIRDGVYSFTLKTPQAIYKNLRLGIPGNHNVENAIAASAACLEAGISIKELENGLASFKGVKRRFEYIIKSSACIFIDDYAHHPEEIKATLSSVKKMYPERKLTAVFQPHLYTRTRDFANGFSESLSIADEVILLDIYPARELPIDGVSSSMLLEKISCQKKSLQTKEGLTDFIKNNKPELLLTLGAGDIDQLILPLKNVLTQEYDIR